MISREKRWRHSENEQRLPLFCNKANGEFSCWTEAARRSWRLERSCEEEVSFCIWLPSSSLLTLSHGAFPGPWLVISVSSTRSLHQPVRCIWIFPRSFFCWSEGIWRLPTARSSGLTYTSGSRSQGHGSIDQWCKVNRCWNLEFDWLFSNFFLFFFLVCNQSHCCHSYTEFSVTEEACWYQ